MSLWVKWTKGEVKWTGVGFDSPPDPLSTSHRGGDCARLSERSNIEEVMVKAQKRCS